jgi:hypothetical protein
VKKIGRNSPCPCGSGKKYKKCCLLTDTKQGAPEQSGRFRFEPGSYGPLDNCVPSIACLKPDRDSWEYHFVLVKPADVFNDPDRASACATADLNDAFSKGKEGGGSDEAVALHLKERGYVAVDDFRIADENSGLTEAWMENDGLHLMGPGPSLSREALEEATKAYQENIRNSPLWEQMVKELGEEQAEKLLSQCRVEERQ